MKWQSQQDIGRLVVILHTLKIGSTRVWENIKNAVLVRIEDELLLLQLLKLLTKNNQLKYEVQGLENEYEQELKNKHQHFKTVLKIKQFDLEQTFEVIHNKLWIASSVEGFDSQLEALKEKYTEQLQNPQFQDHLLQIQNLEIPLQIISLKWKNKLKLGSDILIKLILVIESLCKTEQQSQIRNKEFCELMLPQIKDNLEAIEALVSILTSRAYSDYSITQKDVGYLLETSQFLKERPQVQNVLLFETNRLNTFILDRIKEIEEARESELIDLDSRQTHLNQTIDFDDLRGKATSNCRQQITKFLNKIDWGLWRLLCVELLKQEVNCKSKGLRMFVSGVRKVIEDPRISVYLTIDDYEELLEWLGKLREVDPFDLQFVFRKLHNLKALYTI